MSESCLKNRRRALSAALAFCIVLSCLPGCTGAAPAGRANDPPEPVRLADHLYEISYTADFDQEAAAFAGLPGFSCSGVQNGRYRGRNYDWIYADTDLCVIHACVTESRPHASVAVADMSFAVNDDGSYNYAKLPFVTVDGINDAGVCVQVNVMPYAEYGRLSHTEDTGDDLSGACITRFLLDNASCVEHALELLRDKDIHSEMGTEEELHWMLSGPASDTDSAVKTVVIEVMPDGLHITEDFVDGKPIMTNFNISAFDGTAGSVGIGLGYERWQILDEYYPQADSVMGTFDLMEKVFFTKMYDLYGDRFWYSEYNGTDLANYYEPETLKSILGEDTYSFYMNNYGGVYYTAALWDGEKSVSGDISGTGILSPVVELEAARYNAQSMENADLWMTVHTAVYDLENLTLDLQVREAQDHFHFTLP